MKRKLRILTVALSYLLVLIMPLGAVAMPFNTATIPSIRVCELASKLEYHVGENFSLADTAVYFVENGIETRITDLSALEAEVIYTAAENRILAATGYPVEYMTPTALGLYRTGPRVVRITYTPEGFYTYFEIVVTTHYVYREWEFDLSGTLGDPARGLPDLPRWGTLGRPWPTGMVFTMLDRMDDGTPFDMNWILDPAVIINVDFVTTVPIPGTGGGARGVDNVPDLRLGFLRNHAETGTLNVYDDGGSLIRLRDAVYWNHRNTGPDPGPIQERNYGSVDIRHRFIPGDNGVSIAHINQGPVTVTIGGQEIIGHASNMQAIPEDFLRRQMSRLHFPDGWHYLVLFAGGSMVPGANNPATHAVRVTIGMLEDRPAPWEPGWTPPTVYDITVTADENFVNTGGSLRFHSEMTAADNAIRFVRWDVMNSTQSTIDVNGLLSVPHSERADYLVIRATSLISPTIYGELVVNVNVMPTGYLIPVYYPLRFLISPWWNTTAGFNISREDAHTLPRQSMYFHTGWFREDTILTVRYTAGAPIENIDFGIRRRRDESGLAIDGTPGLGGYVYATLPRVINPDPADIPNYINTHIIIDTAGRTAQVSYEALLLGFADQQYNQALLANGHFFGVTFRGITATQREYFSIGALNVSDIPWVVPLSPPTVINDAMPAPGPLPHGFYDPTHYSGRSLSTQFPGDLGISEFVISPETGADNTGRYVVRWDDFSETTPGRITNVNQLNVGRHRWDGIRLEIPGAIGEVEMFIAERGDTHTAYAPGRAGSEFEISGTIDPYLPGDAAVVFWTNSTGGPGPGVQHFGIELQQYMMDEYVRMIDEAGVVFTRFYQYWAPNYAINGSSHNGVSFQGFCRHRMSDGAFFGADHIIPHGYDWFRLIYEFVRSQNPGLYVPYGVHQRPDRVGEYINSPGEIALYVYHSFQSSMTNRPTLHRWGDLFFPDGSRGGAGTIANYGADWAAHPQFPDRGTVPNRNPVAGGISPTAYGNWNPMPRYWVDNAYWHSIELMVKPNTIVDGVVQRDGRVAGWMNGHVVFDFTNIVLRYTEDLMINISQVKLINSPNIAAAGRETYKMVTQYIMATRYIGPMYRFRHAVRACEYIAELEEFVVDYDLLIAANLEEAIKMFEHAQALVDALPTSNDELDSLQARLDAIWAIITATGQPVFGWNIFNNGPGGTQYPRPNPGLAALGTIRMWAQLDGVNAPVYLDAADTIVALDQDENCAMEFVRVNQMWVAGTGWVDYFNMVDVNKDNGSWQYVNLYITVYGETVRVLLVNALFEEVTLPEFSWNIFNNGPGGTQYPRPNPGLAASGTIRMWTQLDGVNAPVYLDAADTIVALDQSGQCAMEFVRVNRMWVAGAGWSDYFNMVDVNKNGQWQYINLYITVYGETVRVLLANALFEDTPAVPLIVSVTPNPAVVEQGGTVEIVVTTQRMPDGAWVDLNVAWRTGLSIVGGPRFYIEDNQATITVAAASDARLGSDGFAIAARVAGDWGSVVIVDNYAFVIEVQ